MSLVGSDDLVIDMIAVRGTVINGAEVAAMVEASAEIENGITKEMKSQLSNRERTASPSTLPKNRLHPLPGSQRDTASSALPPPKKIHRMPNTIRTTLVIWDPISIYLQPNEKKRKGCDNLYSNSDAVATVMEGMEMAVVVPEKKESAPWMKWNETHESEKMPSGID